MVNRPNLDSTVTTEEDLAAADNLFTLIEPRYDTQDEKEDENAKLMPIGSASKVVDAVPVTVELDQANVDHDRNGGCARSYSRG